MKKALIFEGRLCDIVEAGSEFPVAPGMQWVDAPDDADHDTHEWSGTAVVVKPPVQIAPEELVQKVKAEAQKRIYAVVPAWMQANLTARSAELLRIRIDSGAWTAEEAAEVQAIEAVWDKAKAIRAYSDTLEADVLSGSTTDIYSGWPY